MASASWATSIEHLLPGAADGGMLAALALVATALVVSPPARGGTATVGARGALSCASANLQLELAPPAPPPPSTTSGGGGDGDDGDGDGGEHEFLRLLASGEQAELLTSWISRTRIYKLTDDPFLRQRHERALVDLEAMAAFDTAAAGETGRRMLLGLFDEAQAWAFAAAEVSRSSGLVVSNLVVYPAELNRPESTTSLRCIHALHVRRARARRDARARARASARERADRPPSPPARAADPRQGAPRAAAHGVRRRRV
jgi:hypothetical protein